MPAPPPPLHLSSQFGPYGVFVAPAHQGLAPLEPGERVGGPPPRRRRRVLRTLVVLCLLGPATAWLIVEKREDVTTLAAWASAALQDLQPHRHLPQAPAKDDAKAAEPLPAAEREMAPMPVVHAEPDAQAPAAEPPAAPTCDTDLDSQAPPERLPPVTADAADPLQQKAFAVGLHPDLSRALLARLTPEDFRNAAHAVNAVLTAETAAVPFVWPRQRTPQKAQFKVRLVAGAPAECRRYVVQIAKDGWETTARPMERCTTKQALKPT